MNFNDGWMDGWVDGQMDERMADWVDKWIDGLMDEWQAGLQARGMDVMFLVFFKSLDLL